MASTMVHFDWPIQCPITESCYAEGYYNCDSGLIAQLRIVILTHYNVCYVIKVKIIWPFTKHLAISYFYGKSTEEGLNTFTLL